MMTTLVLKRECAKMLETICELEYEAQTLGGTGCVDLTLENELIRQEIKLYRTLIEQII